jgi:hypothetical protein
MKNLSVGAVPRQLYASPATIQFLSLKTVSSAREIETSEIDSIYSKLVSLGGPKIAQTMENLGVPSRSTRLTQLLYPADSYF